MIVLRYVLCLLVVLSFSSQSRADVFFFGDSLSDSGNTSNLTAGISPGPRYFQGRFSNGPTWAEIYAERIVGAAVASSDGGTNYAYGGARTFSSFLRPGLDSQVSSYLSSGHNPTADDLFVFWIGSNDVFDAVDAADPDGVIDEAIDNIETAINALDNGGVNRMMILNAGPLGQTPLYRLSSNADALDDLSLSFNSELADRIDTIRGVTDLQIREIDMFPLFQEVLADPTAFGLTNATDSATEFSESGFLAGLSTGPATVDPEEYFFWDGIHPTAAGHRIIADRVFVLSVPEPASTTAILVAAVLFSMRRIRSN